MTSVPLKARWSLWGRSFGLRRGRNVLSGITAYLNSSQERLEITGRYANDHRWFEPSSRRMTSVSVLSCLGSKDVCFPPHLQVLSGESVSSFLWCRQEEGTKNYLFSILMMCSSSCVTFSQGTEFSHRIPSSNMYYKIGPLLIVSRWWVKLIKLLKATQDG